MKGKLFVEGIDMDTFNENEARMFKLIFFRNLDGKIWKLWLVRGDPVPITSDRFFCPIHEELHPPKKSGLSVIVNPHTCHVSRTVKGELEYFLTEGLPEEIEIKYMLNSGYIYWKRFSILKGIQMKWGMQFIPQIINEVRRKTAEESANEE